MNYWIRLLSRSFREGSIQLWRNKFLSFSTIFLGGLILFLLNFMMSIEYYADASLARLETKADFVALFDSGYDVFEREALENDLLLFPVSVTRKEPVLEDGILLPERLHITFHELESVQRVFEILKSQRYGVLFQQWDHEGEREFVEIVDQLLRIRHTVERVGFWMLIIFVCGGVFLGLNTFRIVLFSRKDEIFIARLVGAEHRFISWPFLWEGILVGFLSACIGIVVFILVLREVYFLPGGDIFVYFLNEGVFAYQLYGSGLVGGVGAWFAVRRYLFGHFDK